MAIPRIFQNSNLHSGIVLALTPEASNHVLQVLRLKVNDKLLVFNGQKPTGQYGAKIVSAHKQNCQVEIEEFTPLLTESPLTIHLGQALAQGSKMDFIIQKTIELGITAITPLQTRYSLHFDPSRLKKKEQHWQGVAAHALEQCHRSHWPILNPLMHFNDFLTTRTGGFILDPHAADVLTKDELRTEITLLVGPEGGFSADEIAAAQAAAFIPIRLGPRILRTETAPLTMVSLCQYLWGDLG